MISHWFGVLEFSYRGGGGEFHFQSVIVHVKTSILFSIIGEKHNRKWLQTSESTLDSFKRSTEMKTLVF